MKIDPAARVLDRSVIGINREGATTQGERFGKMSSLIGPKVGELVHEFGIVRKFGQALAQDGFKTVFFPGQVERQSAFEIITDVKRIGLGTGRQGADLIEASQSGGVVLFVTMLDRFVIANAGRLGKVGLRRGQGLTGLRDLIVLELEKRRVSDRLPRDRPRN